MIREEFEALLTKSETSGLDWKTDFPQGLLKGKSDPDYEKGRGTLLNSPYAVMV